MHVLVLLDNYYHKSEVVRAKQIVFTFRNQSTSCQKNMNKGIKNRRPFDFPVGMFPSLIQEDIM